MTDDERAVLLAEWGRAFVAWVEEAYEEADKEETSGEAASEGDSLG